jgi:DDE superfamily endonuclease
VAGAQHAAVQRLQFFLSESRWDPGRVNDRRLELLLADPATAPHGGGVLVIDDSGDRKDGSKTAHVGRQWPGRYGKTGNGVVTVTTVRADERVYYPVHAVPYTPARHFAKGRYDPAFRAKLAIGASLAVAAREAGFAFRAVAADSAYGDQDRCGWSSASTAASQPGSSCSPVRLVIISAKLVRWAARASMWGQRARMPSSWACPPGSRLAGRDSSQRVIWRALGTAGAGGGAAASWRKGRT